MITQIKRGLRILRRFRFGRFKGQTVYHMDIGVRIFISREELARFTPEELKAAIDVKLEKSTGSLTEIIRGIRKQLAEDTTSMTMN